MSTATATLSKRMEKQTSAPERLFSLDVFRGATVAAMIVVNNQSGDDAYWPLRHASSGGWTPTDLVFPFFLFIVGVSLVLSFRTRLERGVSQGALIRHTLRRSAILFAIGLALNGLSALESHHLRIPGVLQRIAVVYCAAALITLYTRARGLVFCIAALTIGYWALMRYVPVPGYGVPGRDIPLLHPDANLAAYIDRKLMAGHLWQGTRDPEGILSTLPAIATALCGVLSGEWLRSDRTQKQKLAGMLACGVACAVCGEMWGHWFPISKSLWTSSYVLLTAGFALIAFAICYAVNDIGRHRGRWTRPFIIFGTNAISAYIIAELVGGWFSWGEHSFTRWLLPFDSAALVSLLDSLVVLLLCFLPVWWMYRRRIFLKV